MRSKNIFRRRAYIDYSVWRKSAINYNPRQVNAWWWALGPFGGSLRRQADGKWYRHGNTANRWKQPGCISGPFENLEEAIKVSGVQLASSAEEGK